MSLPLGFRKSKPNDSALGAATKVRIGELDREMSAYSVLTIICLFPGNSGGGAKASQPACNSTGEVFLVSQNAALPTEERFSNRRFIQDLRNQLHLWAAEDH